MDRTRFDELTKALATGASRRSVLKGMLGGVAAGAGVTLVPQMTSAQDETCIEPLGACEMVEGATPCCGSYTCFEAMCDNARGCWDVDQTCDAEFPCCDASMTCVDGTCVADTGDDDGGQGGAEVLPATGSGPAGGSSNWTGAVAAGGAAVAAAMLLRKERTTEAGDTSA